MKKKFAFILFVLIEMNAFAQKEDNIWLGGQFAGINFNSGSPLSFKQPYYNDIWRTNASMCDSNGNLLFYTNGFRVFNRNFQIMQNGDSLNIGDYITYGYDELPIPNGAVIVPIGGSKTRYYLFQSDLDYVYEPTLSGYILLPKKIQYSIVDMSLDSGFGGIEDSHKNIVILNDTLTQTGMEVIKHGNGRDWWLILHKYNSDRYYTFLTDSLGIHGPYNQSTGLALKYGNALFFSEFRFSPNGSQAIQLNCDSALFELYDFNRCNGQLTNRRQIRVSDTLYGLMGLSFSPSGRYFYVSANNWNNLFQFDLKASDIATSKELVGVYDGRLNPFRTNFYDHSVGPDNKIYICNYGYCYSLHVINDPDSPGIKCDFVQNQLELALNTSWGMGFPNSPNYHLGSLKGSICDTLTTTVPPINQNVFTYGVYPNPFINEFQLSITGIDRKVPVVIYNEMREVVFQTTLQPVNGFIHGFFNLQNEPSGVYLLEAKTNRGEVTEKILKQ